LGARFTNGIFSRATVTDEIYVLNNVANLWRHVNLRKQFFVIHEFKVLLLHFSDVNPQVLMTILINEQKVGILAQ